MGLWQKNLRLVQKLDAPIAWEQRMVCFFEQKIPPEKNAREPVLTVASSIAEERVNMVFDLQAVCDACRGSPTLPCNIRHRLLIISPLPLQVFALNYLKQALSQTIHWTRLLLNNDICKVLPDCFLLQRTKIWLDLFVTLL